MDQPFPLIPPIIPPTPVVGSAPVVVKKPFPKWPIFILIFLLGIASVFAYQKFQPTRTLLVGPSPSLNPTPSAAVAPAEEATADWKTYSSPVIGDYLSPFILSYPDSWTIKVDHKTQEPQSLSITLVKDQAEIKILQAMGGGGSCVYFDDPDYLSFQGMGGFYKSYIQLNQSVQWRLSEYRDVQSNTYTVCELSSNRYIDSTRIGWITIKLNNQSNLEDIKMILSQISFHPTATTKTIFN